MTLKSFNRLLLGAALAASGLVASTAAIAPDNANAAPAITSFALAFIVVLLREVMRP